MGYDKSMRIPTIKIINIKICNRQMALFAGDLFCYFLSLTAGYYLDPYSVGSLAFFWDRHIILFLLGGTIYFTLLFIGDILDHQKNYCKLNNLIKVMYSALIGAIVVILLSYFIRWNVLGRTFLLIQGANFVILLCIWRYVFSCITFSNRKMLIIGAGNAGQRLLQAVARRQRCGLLPLGFIDDDPQKLGKMVNGVPVLGDTTRLQEIITQHQVSLVVISITHNKSLKLIDALIKMSWNGVELMDMPTLFEFLTGKVPTAHISLDWLFQWNLNSSRLYFRTLKRLFDIFLAIAFVVASWPLFILIIILIKLDSKGPAFYRQERIGKQGEPFYIIKFRTMVNNAENQGPCWTTTNDPRVTKIGRIIRKLRLDELPQVLNVLLGEMSIIGPRPLVHSDCMNDIPYFNYRFLVKPGITGWAQVIFPEGTNIESTAEKIKYDLYYVKNLSFILDITIILKTMRIVFTGHGI